MKKLLCMILALLMLPMLACVPDNAPETTPEVSPEPIPESTPEIIPNASSSSIPAETPGYIESSERLRYDDYVEMIDGLTPENVVIEGNSIEIAEVGGKKYFHAVDVGYTMISGSTDTDIIKCLVGVEKAKLNIVVVMGQSNSGNHFDNALSDIKNPIGTAYWWGGGIGINATEPSNFTHATKGFHSTLLAELYAQSVKNGDPVKNVLVWHEGGGQDGQGTSKNGSRIYGWAKSPTDASGTDYTVKMVNNCVKYYSELSDKYEIVSSGAYWLQGEGDGGHAIPTDEYIGCFMAMWNKLKSEAGLEYMAIMRVRQGGGGAANNDINHTTVVSAQFTLANENDDIYMATTITENFIGQADTMISVDISKYITLMDKYSGQSEHNDKYNNTATYKDGVLTMPMRTLFGSNNNNHYGKFGYTIIAADAARNMYSALNGSRDGVKESYVGIVQANISGAADEASRRVNKPGDTAELDITNIDKNLRFYADPGSVAGVLSVKVVSGGEDVTDDVVLKSTGVNNRSIYIRELKRLGSSTITVTYAAEDGTEYTVIYNVICKK